MATHPAAKCGGFQVSFRIAVRCWVRSFSGLFQFANAEALDVVWTFHWMQYHGVYRPIQTRGEGGSEHLPNNVSLLLPLYTDQK